jgi:hypothetical protein
MSTKLFLTVVTGLFLLVTVTSPPLVRPFFQRTPTPAPTVVLPTSTPTPTPDPFASVPTVTPRTQGIIIQVQELPAATLGDAPPTFTPTPEGSTLEAPIELPLEPE